MPNYEINQYRGVYKRAVELYESEKFKDAGLLLQKVYENDPENYMACYYLADLLYYGKGIAKNTKKAFDLYMIAATNKVTEASFMVGLCYLEGEGIYQDSIQAVSWFTEAAKYAHPLSQYYLGMAYKNGEGVDKDIPRAAQWLVHAAKSGIVEADKEAGICYETLSKFKGAARLYLAGAEAGDSYCQEKIGDFYADGKGTLQCAELAIHYYELACNQNNVEAMVKLANHYAKGENFPKNIKKAIELWTKAANNGNDEAQNNLAECYHLGDGIVKNDLTAVSWWEKSASQGNVNAMIHLAEILTDPTDNNIDKDLVEAKNWWLKAAEAGDSYAMYRLGDCLEKGIGVSSINLDDAYRWYRLSSQNGYMDATETCKRFTKTLSGKIKIKTRF